METNYGTPFWNVFSDQYTILAARVTNSKLRTSASFVSFLVSDGISIVDVTLLMTASNLCHFIIKICNICCLTYVNVKVGLGPQDRHHEESGLHFRGLGKYNNTATNPKTNKTTACGRHLDRNPRVPRPNPSPSSRHLYE